MFAADPELDIFPRLTTTVRSELHKFASSHQTIAYTMAADPTTETFADVMNTALADAARMEAERDAALAKAAEAAESHGPVVGQKPKERGRRVRGVGLIKIKL